MVVPTNANDWRPGGCSSRILQLDKGELDVCPQIDPKQ